MRRSEATILTTHGGSLPRPPELASILRAREAGEHVDAAELEHLTTQAVNAVVEQQVERGLSVINDGELGRPSYVTYVMDRLTGFTHEGCLPRAADLQDFPGRGLGPCCRVTSSQACTGPISYRGEEATRRDIERLQQATAGKAFTEAFMTAASPGVIALFHPNRHYPSDEAYLTALAEAMRVEYRMIHAAGLVLQVDCPDLAMARHVGAEALSPEEFSTRTELAITALNHALSGLPPSRMRLHVCWGNYAGPHHHDVPLSSIMQSLLRARPSGISFPAANPRHEHEWSVWQDQPLPNSKLLLPGVIDPTTSFIEHRDLVAQRILRFTQIVGKNNVIASTDCGFASFIEVEPLAPELVWEKLDALVQGAELANAQLMPIRSSPRAAKRG